MSLIGRLYFLKPSPALRRWVCRSGLGTSPRASGLGSTRHSLESPPHVGPGGCHQTSHCPECVLSSQVTWSDSIGVHVTPAPWGRKLSVPNCTQKALALLP